MEELGLGIPTGAAVVVFLQNPKEKFWGLLASIGGAGIVLRGLDLDTFEEWLRQEARSEETSVGPLTFFFPLHRVVRIERDESVGPVQSYAERFFREVGRRVEEALGSLA
jgi:hypothetical protein